MPWRALRGRHGTCHAKCGCGEGCGARGWAASRTGMAAGAAAAVAGQRFNGPRCTRRYGGEPIVLGSMGDG
eukprot:6855768-Prymnesium_polylepis.1